MNTNAERLEKFHAIYAEQLRKAVAANPHEYGNPTPERTETTIANMVKAFAMGTANKDGTACRATCKVLGIAHTYKAINAYLQGE